METWHGDIDDESEKYPWFFGPLHISRGDQTNPLYKAFVKAGNQAGFEITSDYNGFKQEGFGVMEQTIYKGRRWSAANAYLKPALKRNNLKLQGVLLKEIVFDGLKAVGVEVNVKGKIKKYLLGKKL